MLRQCTNPVLLYAINWSLPPDWLALPPPLPVSLRVYGVGECNGVLQPVIISDWCKEVMLFALIAQGQRRRHCWCFTTTHDPVRKENTETGNSILTDQCISSAGECIAMISWKSLALSKATLYFQFHCLALSEKNGTFQYTKCYRDKNIHFIKAGQIH